MSDVRLAVIYDSTYGHNHVTAETDAEAARAAGAEVRLRKGRATAPPEMAAIRVQAKRPVEFAGELAGWREVEQGRACGE